LECIIDDRISEPILVKSNELKVNSTMETPQVKSEIIRAIQDLPEDATVEDAMERLYFLAKIERGLEQSESGETISHEEIKARFLR
jgi:hypothetical protein